MINGRKIGFMPTGSFSQMSPDRVCGILADIGYDAVEWTQHFASPFRHTAAELKELSAAARRHGLTVSEIMVQKDFIVRDEAEYTQNINYVARCIETCAGAGTNIINLFSGPIPWSKTPLIVGRDIKEGEAWGMLCGAVEKLLPLAERHGVYLAFENVWGMLAHDYYTLAPLFSKFNSAFLAVNYDPSHDVFKGHTDIPFFIKEWGSRIKHVHLKDAVPMGNATTPLFPLLGEGNVDWRAFGKALDLIGYQGVLSVEFEAFHYVSKILGNDWVKAAELSFEALKKLFS